MEEILSSLEDKIHKNDNTIFEDFRTIVLRNDIDLIFKIWEKFPNYVWTCLSGHMFKEISHRGMYDIIDLFIDHNKLCGGACMFAEMYREDPEKWKSRFRVY